MTWHSAPGLDALPVGRLHRLVRDTSRPAPGPDLLVFTELAARLLTAAAEAAGETGDPRGFQEFGAVIPAQGAGALRFEQTADRTSPYAVAYEELVRSWEVVKMRVARQQRWRATRIFRVDVGFWIPRTDS